MTTGNKVFADWNVGTRGTIHPNGTRNVQGTTSIGQRHQRVWNGTDYPPIPPVYEYFEYYSPKTKKVYRRKARVDTFTRRKTEDHPYVSTTTYDTDSDMAYQTAIKVPIWPFGPNDWLWDVQTGTFGSRASMLGDSFGFTNQWTSNDDIALIGKLREQIEGSDFNAGVFLAESQQALNLVTENTRKIFKALKAVRKRGIRAGLQALGIEAAHKRTSRKLRVTAQEAASLHLQFTYGVKPLMQDIQGAIGFVSKCLEQPFIQTYRVSKTKFMVGSNGNLQVTGYARGYTRKRIIARLSEVSVIKLLGLQDVGSIIWEKIPYSFIADWFIPIGSYLNARGLAQSLSGTFVTTSKTLTNKAWIGFRPNIDPVNQKIVQLDQPNSSVLRIDFSRSVSANIQVPIPTFKPLEKVASWQHCANAVALVVSRFGSSSGWRNTTRGF